MTTEKEEYPRDEEQSELNQKSVEAGEDTRVFDNETRVKRPDGEVVDSNKYRIDTSEAAAAENAEQFKDATFAERNPAEENVVVKESSDAVVTDGDGSNEEEEAKETTEE